MKILMSTLAAASVALAIGVAGAPQAQADQPNIYNYADRDTPTRQDRYYGSHDYDFYYNDSYRDRRDYRYHRRHSLRHRPYHRHHHRYHDDGVHLGFGHGGFYFGFNG